MIELREGAVPDLLGFAEGRPNVEVIGVFVEVADALPPVPAPACTITFRLPGHTVSRAEGIMDRGRHRTSPALQALTVEAMMPVVGPLEAEPYNGVSMARVGFDSFTLTIEGSHEVNLGIIFCDTLRTIARCYGDLSCATTMVVISNRHLPEWATDVLEDEEITHYTYGNTTVMQQAMHVFTRA